MEPTTVPTDGKMHPGYFFLSLGVLISLITSVVSFLNLVFATLEKKFPDVLNATYQYGYTSYSYDAMRGALATLIIAFPVFVAVSYVWKKSTNAGLGRTDEIIRKWMVYLVLFLSTVVVAVDLVTLVRYFVSGEVTTRFMLKVLVVLVVAGMVGIYYLLEIRAKDLHTRAGLVFGIFASVLVLGSVVWSFMVMGSPATQRAYRLDERRVSDLQSIQWQVINYWQQKQKLPKDLSDLANPISGYSLPVDPEFDAGVAYEYNTTGKMAFELCATFSKPMPKGWQENSGTVMPMPMAANEAAVSTMARPAYGGVNESWDHDAGRTCFTRTIDPDMYPPIGKPIAQ
jgi:hypothetical protein